MILKADISKTSPGRHLFLFIFICGNSKCTRIQKIKNFSGEVNWVHQALNKHIKDYLPFMWIKCNIARSPSIDDRSICLDVTINTNSCKLYRILFHTRPEQCVGVWIESNIVWSGSVLIPDKCTMYKATGFLGKKYQHQNKNNI